MGQKYQKQLYNVDISLDYEGSHQIFDKLMLLL